MVDPVSNEVVSQLTQVGDAVERGGSEGVGGTGSEESTSFQDVLDRKRGADGAEGASEGERVESSREVERAELDAVDDADPTPGERAEKFQKFVEGISDDHREIDQMLKQSLHGGALDQKQLLEMQALIYSYSKKVELTSKVVEKGTGGLKQMMQMRV